MNRCYVKSITQVSCQKPLSEEWLTAPIWYEQSYERAIEPDSKEFIVPSEARRMSKVLKRTICTAISALNKSGITQPEAIITGTGMGCLENSEKFLIDIAKFGENCLKPTLFMQSTHNTISSLIGIVLKCHGYNNTYSHKGISFESALLDAWLQIKAGTLSSALVGSHDEVTPFLSLIQSQTHPEYRFISESSVSTILLGRNETLNGLCEVEKVNILYKPDKSELIKVIGEDSSILMMGLNGNEINDEPYLQVLTSLQGNQVCLYYKHLFGENFSSSAIGFYSAIKMLESENIPDFMVYSGHIPASFPDSITIVTHSDATTWAIIKIKKD